MSHIGFGQLRSFENPSCFGNTAILEPGTTTDHKWILEILEGGLKSLAVLMPHSAVHSFRFLQASKRLQRH